MKNKLNLASIMSVLILFLSGCASPTATSLPYEYPRLKLSPSGSSGIAVVYPEDKRTPNESIDKIWSDDPIKEIDKVIQEEIKSTGLFNEVLPVAKEEVNKSGSRMVLHTSVMELKWDTGQSESGGNSSVSLGLFGGSGGSGGFGGISFGSGGGSTDLYGKAIIKVTLVDQDTGQNLLNKDYLSRVMKAGSRNKSEDKAKVIGKALKDVMDQLKVDLKGLSKENKL